MQHIPKSIAILSKYCGGVPLDNDVTLGELMEIWMLHYKMEVDAMNVMEQILLM